MSRIKINNGSWQYVNTADIPQRGIDYWNQADQQAAFDYADAEIAATSENVMFTLLSSDNEDIMGLTVVFTNVTEGTTEEFVWEGSPITVVVTEGHQYKFYCDGSSKFHKSGETTTYTAVASNNRDVVLTLVYNPPTDLSMYDIYGNEIAQTTANCYVIKEAGTYKFPLVYGNALKNGTANSTSYTNNSGTNSHDFVAHDGTVITTPYIENLVGSASSVQLSIADTDGVFTNISIIDGSPCRYVQFEVASVPATGANSIISIKNSSGVIMWNWHIWIWPDSLETVTITNYTGYDYEILPVNLGSKWETSSSTPTQIKNWYYQWGRPNPMPLASVYNSGTEPTLYGTYTSLTKTTYASDFQTGIKNPNVFYGYNSDGTGNWFGSTSYYNLWDANCTSIGASDNSSVKSIYDPSPVGFKVPNGNTFTGFTTTGSNTSTTSQFNIVGSFNNGWYFKKNSSDSTGVFFPASGFRFYDSGDLAGVGSYGCYWSSAAGSQRDVYYLYFNPGEVYPLNIYYRAGGFSVRCAAEQDVINFTIDGVSYSAEAGMTWTEWTESGYNTDGFSINNNNEYVFAPVGGSSYVCATDNKDDTVHMSDYILNGHVYYIRDITER